MKLISGTSNPSLAGEIAGFLDEKLTPVLIKKFKDGEIYVRIQESIRGEDLFLIQSLCSPVNDNLMELLLLIDAARRASANSVTAVIPYYGYARQDRKVEPREPISAKLVAKMLEKAGADRVLTMDLHAAQIQGFFDIPLDDLWAAPLFKEYFSRKGLRNAVVVAPDSGSLHRARHMGKLLHAPLAVIDKRRTAHNEAEVMNILGEVKGRNAVLIDDIIDTAGTITKAAAAVKERGAETVTICATHGVLSENAVERLESCPAKEVVLTNTIPIKSNEKIKVLSVAPLIGVALKRIYNKESVSELANASIKTSIVV